MAANEHASVESLDAWLTGKPYWEQYVWKLNRENESLSEGQVDQCYRHLCEHLGLIQSAAGTRPPISFESESAVYSNSDEGLTKIKISEVKNFRNVNALSEDCSIKCGPNLTLIYGGNGSGKSGVSRLLCNACFSRGEREILPNVKSPTDSTLQVGATFVLDDGSEEGAEIDYSLGDDFEELKRFSVFDFESVLIHLDQSNNVNFTPAQIQIFDRVADTISRLEEKLTNDKNARRKANPFQSMFPEDATSPAAIFCRSISGATKSSDFLKHADFDAKSDGEKIVALQKQIDGMKKLDVPKKKAQLTTDRQNLAALKGSLQRVIGHFTTTKTQESNKLVKDILERRAIIKSLSVESFDDGVLSTIGSAEWRSLISAAKALYENEKAANSGKELAHCMLCHQKLGKDARSLFQKYWHFLESKAESQLADLTRKHSLILRDLRSAKIVYPKFLPTDAGIKVLSEENPKYLAQLKVQFGKLAKFLESRVLQISRFENVGGTNPPAVGLTKIDQLSARKAAEETSLVDPSIEIAKLASQLTSLQHRKQVTAVKKPALEYIAYLNWLAKANSVNFAGIKMATTRKRTESFLAGVVKDYKGVFNQELANLDCEFNLTMYTSGEQGNTVKEYRLDFAEDYSPSQVLSEGEQNACSLADFLTEAQLDRNNSGIIFDDPVTSLDHERKDKIGRRLVFEAKERQVIIFTHDIVFMSQLVKHADQTQVPFVAHWMRKVGGVPGHVEDNSSPKLANLVSLKKDAQDAVKDYESGGAKQQELALDAAFGFLRSACEALIEEVLFAGAIQRWDDHIKVQNLEEAVFDQSHALRIVDLHGRLSAVILAHNRSDVQRENPPNRADLTAFWSEFEELESGLKQLRSGARKAREARKESKGAKNAGW